MFEALVRRVAIAGSAVVLACGCSNDPALTAPERAPTVLPGIGESVLPGHRTSLPHVWPGGRAGNAEILFVSDRSDSQVLLYDPNDRNPKPKASIVDGVNVPIGLAVDRQGALYVANGGNDTITVYPKGSSSPSLTIDKGLFTPYGVTVDSRGNVFATSPGNDTVLGFRAGATAPFETFDFKKFGQPSGIASDGRDNVWVTCSNTNRVFEISRATGAQPRNAQIPGLLGPIGISFGPNSVMYISNFATGVVDVYAYRSRTPFETITNGIETAGPTLNGVTHSGKFFQSNQDVDVVGYKEGQTSPFSTIRTIEDPVGIAASPLVKK